MIGNLLISTVCFAAVLLSLPAVSFTGLSNWCSLAASSTAFTAMSLNQVLATRPRLLEPMFGGLDRVYRVHRNLGLLTLALLCVHYFVTPNFKGLQATDESNTAAKLSGQIAFYIFVTLACVSLVKRIPFTRLGLPYHVWRQTHRLMGLMFCLASFHQLVIKKPAGSADAALFDFLAILAAVGISSFVVAEIAPLFKGRRYVISRVETHPSATFIEARPASRPLQIRPGQFAFVSVAKSGLREPHPFTVAGQGADGSLRFAVKPSGDYTKRLQTELMIGDELRIEGGYGRFNFTRGGTNQLWLAAGIGITPFLAMIEALVATETRRIHLVHCIRSLDEAIDLERIAAKANAVGSFTYALHQSVSSGRLDAAKLRLMSPFDLNEADLWFCGPSVLRTSIVDGLRRDGIRFGRVEFERFEFR